MKLRLPHKATIWAILAGICYVLCFPKFDLPLLSLLFFPCLLMSVTLLKGQKHAWFLGLMLSSMVAVGGFHWIIYVAQNFGDLPLPLAFGLLMLFCLVAAPQMLAFLLLGEMLRSKIELLSPSLRVFFWASLYVSLEYLARLVKIFPENLGNTWVAFSSISQVAALGGVPLLSFLPIVLGAAFFYLRKEGVRALPALMVAIGLLCGAQLWGVREKKRLAQVPTETIRIGFIQHNMDDAEKRFARTSTHEVVGTIVGRLIQKSRELARTKPAPDLILWAETSYPMVFPTSPASRKLGNFSYGYANLLKDAAAEIGIPILFGGYANEREKDFNAGILLGKNGEVLDRYLKQVLLIFGEYFPMDQWFPQLKQLNPMMGDFGRGPGAVPVSFPWKGHSLLLGVNICYEAILPEYMRGYAQKGARLFVNLTKDSWFGDTFEPWQHFQLSILRSVENRIPMVRATNTGLSGSISFTGDIRLLSQPFEESYQIQEVKLPLSPEKTPYSLFGEWFALALICFVFGTAIWMKRFLP